MPNLLLAIIAHFWKWPNFTPLHDCLRHSNGTHIQRSSKLGWRRFAVNRKTEETADWSLMLWSDMDFVGDFGGDLLLQVRQLGSIAWLQHNFGQNLLVWLLGSPMWVFASSNFPLPHKTSPKYFLEPRLSYAATAGKLAKEIRRGNLR